MDVCSDADLEIPSQYLTVRVLLRLAQHSWTAIFSQISGRKIVLLFRMAQNGTVPMLSAVSSSARQLFLLLRCISFASKTQVRITADGLRFSAEESSVMEGKLYIQNDQLTIETIRQY